MSNPNTQFRQAADSAASAAAGLDVGTTTGRPAPAPASSDFVAAAEAAKGDAALRAGEAQYGLENQTGRVLDDPRTLERAAAEQAAGAAMGAHVATTTGSAPPAPASSSSAADATARRGDEVERAEQIAAGIRVGKVVPNPK